MVLFLPKLSQIAFLSTQKKRFLTLSQNMIELYFTKDYSWTQASIDSNIHHHIYSQIIDAKYISFTMPPFTTAYALNHNIIRPKDYFGYTELGTIEIVDPKSFENWYDRAQSEISHYFQTKKTNIMIIRGYGVYSFNSDLHVKAKRFAI